MKIEGKYYEQVTELQMQIGNIIPLGKVLRYQHGRHYNIVE
jgi:hypothetical protein